MKVYDCKGFANPARVRIALAEKGLFDKVEFIQVDVPGGEHRTPEFLAKNPSGVVPMLELDDGEFISECTAITEYLDHFAGPPTLTGRTATERARIHMMQRKVEAGLLEAVSHYFHHATDGLASAQAHRKTPAWGERQKETALTTLRWMDGVLAGRDYLAGDAFTVADITAMGGVLFADFVKLEIPETARNVRRWRERVFARPSAALAA